MFLIDVVSFLFGMPDDVTPCVPQFHLNKWDFNFLFV